MSTVRNHLQKAHEMMASHHREMAECHKGAMAKAVAGDAMKAFHENAAAAHENAADQHDAMCEECAKAVESDLQKIQPTRVSAVTPTAPVRLVTRHGQREVPLADIDPQFRKLIEVDEQEEYER